jgi:DNA-binding NtrC family response regulator
LLASQLFGHRRGSFTGATHNHRGFFESATGGTLFLDEIGDISPAVQTSLLRVLEERTIIRLGDAMPRSIDVRVIVATHRDLQVEIEAGRFRSDLFFRIQVARIGLPALRDRTGDIPALASYFLRECRVSMEKPVRGLAEEAIGVLVAYPWPGNVRELKSAIEYAMIGCKSEWIGVEDLPPEIPRRARAGLPALPRETEEVQIRQALDRASGSRTEAARLLGVSRSTLYRRMRLLQIR